ncbi:MAG: pyridoxamine 5'-phosphate oxidase family protein [Flavobacteriales bacterium]|nr:pyridoxamine 5'-phosphate oxidase family protein [Flavobacteriales bacterium]
MDKKELKHIVQFISSQQVFTLATTSGHGAYCTPCYYAFEPVGIRLLFMSDPTTRHITELIADGRVAGSILPDRSALGRVRGVQFMGMAYPCDSDQEYQVLKDIYLKRFPIARAMEGELFAVRLDWLKMTDNTLGFGKKLLWDRKAV